VARRCLVADYKRIHYPLYKINYDEREREREREGLRTKRFEHESPVAADNINRNKDDHLRIKYQYLLSTQLIAIDQ